jgi:hypothetical protein
MKREYSFKNGERGKFARPGTKLQLPVYLEQDVMKYFSEQTAKNGVPVNDIVNELLKREIETIRTVEIT